MGDISLFRDDKSSGIPEIVIYDLRKILYLPVKAEIPLNLTSPDKLISPIYWKIHLQENYSIKNCPTLEKLLSYPT